MVTLTKVIYENVEVCSCVLEHHKKTQNDPPKGYHWQARKSQAGVIVEAVEDEQATKSS